MPSKETIGKLTPFHFKNGENFDKKSFSSLIDSLLKQRSNAWKMPVLCLAGILLSLVFSASGGAIGNFIAVVCVFAGIIGGNLSVMGSLSK